MGLTIFQNKRTPFQALKTRSSKSPKNCRFSKLVNRWFWSKNGHFLNFFWRGKTGQENVFQDILHRENTFLGFKNKKFKKQKNCHFSKRVNPWFWSKNGHFFNFFFLGKIGQDNVFYVILERKNTFLGYKNKTLKKLKNSYFSKGATHCFWTRMAFFATSFYQAKQARKMSFTIFQNEKTPFQALQKKKFKKSINCYFCKGVNPWLWSKNGHFFNFFFLGNIGQEHVFHDILERINAILGYKKKVQKLEKLPLF